MSKAADVSSARHFAVLAGTALLLAASAITIRRNGVAFVPPLAFMLLRSRYLDSLWTSLSSRSKRLVWIFGAVTVSAIAAFFAFTSYWRLFVSDARARYHIIPLSFLPWYRLKEFGRIVS